MKKILSVGLIALIMVLLTIFAILPAFAQGDGGATSPEQETWKAMHQACENGDWQAMADAAEDRYP